MKLVVEAWAAIENGKLVVRDFSDVRRRRAPVLGLTRKEARAAAPEAEEIVRVRVTIETVAGKRKEGRTKE